MGLKDFKMPSLKEKLETKAVLEKELAKVDEEIDEVTSPKKVKIKRKIKK